MKDILLHLVVVVVVVSPMSSPSLSTPVSVQTGQKKLARLHSIFASHSNDTNEVFMESVGIIQKPTDLQVAVKLARTHLRRLRRQMNTDMLTIEDPQWKNQWYLYRDPEPSLNVAAAWQISTGRGITVGVVSDGVHRGHQDLHVVKKFSYDFNKDMAESSDSEGTKVAGVIAASKNQLCGVGVAFDAKIADIRLIGSNSTGRMQALAVTKSLNNVDIYLHSWACHPTILNTTDVGMSATLESALKTGATQGRRGRGVIHVWDTRSSNHNNSCAYDPLINSRYTIPITGVTKGRQRLHNGTACSAVLATAYSQNEEGEDHIVTTSGTSSTSCTDKFGGSSAAAAMATGIIALALQANPRLGWRDVQHLLVHSSNAMLLKKSTDDFVFNGAALMVSNKFGFGLMDAAKLVAMAKVWPLPVPPAVNCTYTLADGSLSEPSGSSSRASTIQVSPVSNCNIDYLEHVEVTFNLTYSNGRGNVQLLLESPSGTKTVLVPGRRGDDFRKVFTSTVLSVHFWGENPSGGWKLTIGEAPGSKFSPGTVFLHSWSLMFHGMNQPLELPQGYHVPSVSNSIMREEVVDDGLTNSPLDFPSANGSDLPWWIWLVLGLCAVFIAMTIAIVVYKRISRGPFNLTDKDHTEEETQSLNQEKQQTTVA